jgi:putative tryptophan/tyrosine transport system substrate-binding protein
MITRCQINFVFAVLMAFGVSCVHAVNVIMVSPATIGVHPSVKAFRDTVSRRIPEAKIAHWQVKNDEFSALPDRIRKEKPDLVFTWGTPVTLAIAGRHDSPDGIKDIPVVFCFVADPIRAKLVKDAQRPGRNMTGASHLAPLATQFRSIRQYASMEKLGVVYNPTEPNAVAMVEALKDEAKTSKVTLLLEAIDVVDGKPDPSSLPAKIAQVKAAGADWLYMGPDTFVSLTHQRIVTRAALDNQLPTFAATETPIRAGDGLFGLYSATENVGRFAAFKAIQILRKEKPIEEIAIETLQRFVVIINITTARTLDKIPPLSLLKIADVRNAPLGPPPAIPAPLVPAALAAQAAPAAPPAPAGAAAAKAPAVPAGAAAAKAPAAPAAGVVAAQVSKAAPAATSAAVPSKPGATTAVGAAASTKPGQPTSGTAAPKVTPSPATPASTPAASQQTKVIPTAPAPTPTKPAASTITPATGNTAPPAQAPRQP